jgi:serine/threonine protein kinase
MEFIPASEAWDVTAARAPRVKFDDYCDLQYLREGGWGKVYAAVRKSDHKKVAMKFFGYTGNEPIHSEIYKEIALLMNLAGVEGIVQLEGVFDDTAPGYVKNKNPSFRRSYPVIVMEQIQGGELYDRILNRETVS